MSNIQDEIARRRTFAIISHPDAGKTTLTEKLLLFGGQIQVAGAVKSNKIKKTATSDWMEIEKQRGISVTTSVMEFDYEGYKINILDTPGFFDFAGEVFQALRVSESGLIVVTAKGGVGVGTEKAWKQLSTRKMPKMIYVSKIDEDNADYMSVLNAMREQFGISVVPVIVPVVEGGKNVGVYDMVSGKAYKMNGNKTEEMSVPASMEDDIATYAEMLNENVAETSEELMDKFFGGEDFTYAEMIKGMHKGVIDHTLYPVLCGSGVTCLGSLMLMDHIIDLLPNPVEGNYHKATTADGSVEEFIVSPGGVPSAFVFKTVSDQRICVIICVAHIFCFQSIQNRITETMSCNMN